MRNLVASSIRRWRFPLAPNLSESARSEEQIVATCYDPESRVTYAVTDNCNLYGVHDDAAQGEDTQTCLEMCLVEPVREALRVRSETNLQDVAGEEKEDREAMGQTDTPIDQPEPDVPLAEEADPPALSQVSKIVGMAWVDDIRGVCIACATGELIVVAPDPDDLDDPSVEYTVLTKDLVPECVGKVAQGLRAMRWNPDGELLVLATWAGTLIMMTKDFRVLAEAPVGGGGGDGIASLSWRGDGQFLASLVSARNDPPLLRVWEREDLLFHATGESLKPARIAAGNVFPVDEEFNGMGKQSDGVASNTSHRTQNSLPSSPPLAWQPRGALVAVATAVQAERDDDSDVDSTDTEAEGKDRQKREVKKLPATEAQIVFFERNGLRRGEFSLPKKGAGTVVTQLAWSCASERLAVCVSNPENLEQFRMNEQYGDTTKTGSACQIWRRGNGRWYLSREIRFGVVEGERVTCAWDSVDPQVLRVITPGGLLEEHVLVDELTVSSAGTVAVIDGHCALITPLAKTIIPPPMAAATISFPTTVADICFSPSRCVNDGSGIGVDNANNGAKGAISHGVLPGEHALALLSDGRLAMCSASKQTGWEETADDLLDEDDENEFSSDNWFASDGDVALQGKVVHAWRGGQGTTTMLEDPADIPRRIAWIDANTVLLTTERPSDGSCSLLSIKLSKNEPQRRHGHKTGDRDIGWTCECVAVVDLPAYANAIAIAEGESPASAFVQLQTDMVISDDTNDTSAVLLATDSVDSDGYSALNVVPVIWPSARLPKSCVAIHAMPPVEPGGPPSLAGLDSQGTLRCGTRVIASDVRSFTTHFGAMLASSDDSVDMFLASAVANAKAWSAWSANDNKGGEALPPPSARLVFVTNSDELRVAELHEIFEEDAGNGFVMLENGDISHVLTDSTNNQYSTAAGGTRIDKPMDQNTPQKHQQNIDRKLQQNDQLHVSMRAAMRPADASRQIDSRTRRVEQGARIVVAPPGGVDVVLQMPRGNLETVAPRFLVLPAVAAAIDSNNFATAAKISARHRVDFNLIIDRAWPRFLSKAYEFVKDVDDPDVVAEVLECLDSGDVTAAGKPYAHVRKPVTLNAHTGDDDDSETGTVMDIARKLLVYAEMNPVGSTEVNVVDSSQTDNKKDKDEDDDGSEELKRNDPRGKIRLTCSVIASAVARCAAERDFESGLVNGFGEVEGGVTGGVDGDGITSLASDGVTPAKTLQSRSVKSLTSVELQGGSVAHLAQQASELIDAMSKTTVDINGEKVSTVSSPGSGLKVRTSWSTTKTSMSASASGSMMEMMESTLHEQIGFNNDDANVTSSGSVSTSTFKNATLTWSTDTLLKDRWELVILSAQARSQPPDLAGALSRVRRRREAEIDQAKVRDGTEFGIVGTTPTTATQSTARGFNSRLATTIDNLDVDSDLALDHLLSLEGGKPLFDAAMGTYDLATAYLVGQKAPGMDPGEYLPELERLAALPEGLRKADIDIKLKRWRPAVEHLLLGGAVEKACAIARERRMFPHALAVTIEKEKSDFKLASKAALEAAKSTASASSPRTPSSRRLRVGTKKITTPYATSLRKAVATAYAGQLSDERRHEDAAVTLLSVGDEKSAMREYANAGAYRPALALAGRVGLKPDERKALATEIADQLEQFDPASAAVVAERELQDIDRATSLLTVAKKWRDCTSVAYAHGRGDLVDTVVAPAAAIEADATLQFALEAPDRAEKYLERLRKLREHREALAKALGMTGGVANQSYKTGKPGAANDDDDAVSEAASLSTLASGMSGFSAYTDRTLGAQTTTTASGTSLSASTIGGRKANKKPSRKERRGKKATGLRAGGPTEEKDLAMHLANGGVCSDLLAAGALENVGELSELLVVLGHDSDAAKLQSAVAAALAAHEKASLEARKVLDILNEMEKKEAAANGLPNPTPPVAQPCPCPACQRSRSKGCLASQKSQWKWAALRTVSAEKKGFICGGVAVASLAKQIMQ